MGDSTADMMRALQPTIPAQAGADMMPPASAYQQSLPPARTTTATIRGESGRSGARAIRNFVDEQRFLGRDIEMWEGRGWLTRPWIVRGDPRLVRAISEWIDRVNAEEEREIAASKEKARKWW